MIYNDIIICYYIWKLYAYQIISGYIRHITPETARFSPFAKSLAPNSPKFLAVLPSLRAEIVVSMTVSCLQPSNANRGLRWVKRQNSKCTARATAASKSSNTSELYWFPSIKHVLIAKNWRKTDGNAHAELYLEGLSEQRGASNCWG